MMRRSLARQVAIAGGQRKNARGANPRPVGRVDVIIHGRLRCLGGGEGPTFLDQNIFRGGQGFPRASVDSVRKSKSTILIDLMGGVKRAKTPASCAASHSVIIKIYIYYARNLTIANTHYLTV